MSNVTLYQITDQLRGLELIEEDVPPEVFRDTLEALQGDLSTKVSNVAQFLRNQEALADAIDGAADSMAKRSKALRNRAQWLREYLLVNMQASGITKIESPYLKISVRANPESVLIFDEEAIPSQYLTTPPPSPPPAPRPDKTAIKAAIKGGAHVPGCELRQGFRLEVK